jgi:predicted house-cleaning noncanonical NTP pyrophosphatase (MazG superfamily)
LDTSRKKGFRDKKNISEIIKRSTQQVPPKNFKSKSFLNELLEFLLRVLRSSENINILMKINQARVSERTSKGWK